VGDVRFRAGVVLEIPLLSSFLYLLGKVESRASPPSGGRGSTFWSEVPRRPAKTPLGLNGPSVAGSEARSPPRTLSGGEFDWGGTSVKR
jgi:hypothetical protein